MKWNRLKALWCVPILVMTLNSSSAGLEKLPRAVDGEISEIRLVLGISRGTVPELVDAIRSQGVPLSFVQAPSDGKVVEIKAGNVKLGQVLDAIISRSPAYEVRYHSGRIVLLPQDKKFQSRIEGVYIKGTPRLEATYIYVERLNVSVPGFENLAPPLLKGNPDAPLYKESVILSEQGTVLEHLFQLLGDDPSTVFSIIPAKTGIPFLVFERVEKIPSREPQDRL